MAVLVALYEAKDQVSDIEGPTSHSTAVVLAQRLLVSSQAGEGDVARFI